MKEVIEETTMGRLGDVPTGMASMGAGSYLLPDGSEAHGMSCVLAPMGEDNVIVGLGSVVDIQGASWEVVGIDKIRGEPGTVTLELQKGLVNEGEGVGSTLDYRYSTECPSCGEVAGWDGGIGQQLGEPVMYMRCEDCGNAFGWYSGQLAPLLKNSPPAFMAGAGTPPEGQR